MSVFVVAEELQTASNCRQQVGVSVGRERGRQQGQAVIRGLPSWELPLAAPLAAPSLPTAEPAGCPSLLGCERSRAVGAGL